MSRAKSAEGMSLQEAASEVRKWGQLIRALSTVEDVLDAAQADVALTAERKRVLAGLQEDIAKANAELTGAKAKLSQATADAKATIDSAQVQAKSLLHAATEQADQIRAKATADVEAAGLEAEGARKSATEARRRATLALKELEEAKNATDKLKAAARAIVS